MAKYLDKTGLEYFWGKLKIYLNNKYQAKGDYATNTALNNEIQTIYDGPIVYLQEDIDALNTELQEVRSIAEGASEICNDMNADVAALYNTKQDNLVSGTNIKTINGQSILGSGNIVIEGGSSGGEGDSSAWKRLTGTITLSSSDPVYFYTSLEFYEDGDTTPILIGNDNDSGLSLYAYNNGSGMSITISDGGIPNYQATVVDFDAGIWKCTLPSMFDGTVVTSASTSDIAYLVSSGNGGSDVTIDSSLSPTSTNPVQNKVIYQEIQDIYNGPIAYLEEDINSFNQGLNSLQGEILNNNKFKILNRVTLEVNKYTDISSYMSNYNELMIIVRVVPNANSTIGIANNTSGSSGFLASLATSATTYFKMTMNKTDEGYYAWTITSSTGNLSTFGWTSSTGYKYIRNYSSSATSISMSVVIHGR